MSTPRLIELSGNIKYAEVDTILSQVNILDDSPLEIALNDVEELDITCIQLLLALKDKLGDKFTLKLGAFDPNLESLLASSGVLKLIKDSSN